MRLMLLTKDSCIRFEFLSQDLPLDVKYVFEARRMRSRTVSPLLETFNIWGVLCVPTDPSQGPSASLAIHLGISWTLQTRYWGLEASDLDTHTKKETTVNSFIITVG